MTAELTPLDFGLAMLAAIALVALCAWWEATR